MHGSGSLNISERVPVRNGSRITERKMQRTDEQFYLVVLKCIQESVRREKRKHSLDKWILYYENISVHDA